MIGLAAIALAVAPFPVSAEPACRPARELGAFTRSAQGEQLRTLREDLDGDGVEDSAAFTTSSGSGFSGTDVALKLSTQPRPLEFTLDFAYAAMVNANAIPAALLDSPALEKVEALALGDVCDGVDPSLARLLSPQAPLAWFEGSPRLPRRYSVRSRRAEDLKRLEHPSGVRAVWLTYLGNTHTAGKPADAPEFRVLASDGKRELLGTAHGVVLRDVAANRHAWLWVTPSAAKLRWPTVKSATFEGHTAAIVLEYATLDESARVVVNLKTGTTVVRDTSRRR